VALHSERPAARRSAATGREIDKPCEAGFDLNPSTSAPAVDPVLALGKPVFPCSPDHKRPLVPGESSPGAKDGGLHLATTDQAQIRTWWSNHPDALIGMRTGPASGVVVIDLDPKRGSADAMLKEKPLSPIDVVIEWEGAADAVAAALWLCGVLGIDPESLGYRCTGTRQSKAQASARPQDERWRDDCMTDAHARPIPNLANVMLALRRDPRPVRSGRL